MNATLLSTIEHQLNTGGRNYNVFLDHFVQPRQQEGEPRGYIHAAFGKSAVIETLGVVTASQVVETVESSLTYAGATGAGPSQATLDSEQFQFALQQLIRESRHAADTAARIWEFRLVKMPPARSVFWDFSFLFLLPEQAVIWIGTGSE